MSFSYSRGSCASDRQIFAGELSALAIEVKGLTAKIKQFNAAVQKAKRDASRPRQAVVTLPSRSVVEIAEATPEAAEAEIERLCKLFPGARVERPRVRNRSLAPAR